MICLLSIKQKTQTFYSEAIGEGLKYAYNQNKAHMEWRAIQRPLSGLPRFAHNDNGFLSYP